MQTTYFAYGTQEMNYLKQVDSRMKRLIEELGFVERRVFPDLFQALVFAIIGQQISVPASYAILDRLQSQMEVVPEVIQEKTIAELQACGLSRTKAEVIKRVADHMVEQSLQLEQLKQCSDAEVIEQLTAIKGLGLWSAQMILIHCLERPNVMSFKDIAIKRGLCKLYELEELTWELFEYYRSLFDPYNTVASIYLWKYSAKDTPKIDLGS